MRVVPGRHGLFNRKVTRKGSHASLFDTTHTREASYQKHQSRSFWVARSRRYKESTLRRLFEQYTNRAVAAAVAGDDRIPEPCLSAIEEKGPINALRWVAAVRVPWFDTRRWAAEWGYRCLKYSHSGVATSRRRWNEVFTEESFKKQWETCGSA